MTDSITSYINSNEIESSKRIIEDFIGFKPPKVCGFNMIIKLHIREEDTYEPKDKQGNPVLDIYGNKVKIALPKSIRENEPYSNCIALVIAQGDRCFSDPEFKDTGPLCRVGDFIMFPRNECLGTQLSYKGLVMHVIVDKCVYNVLKSPLHCKSHEMKL